MVRIKPSDPFKEVDYPAENMTNMPPINLNKTSEFVNVDTIKSPKVWEVTEKPSNNMPAPRGRSRAERSRTASSSNARRNTSNQTLAVKQAITQTQQSSKIQLNPNSSDKTSPMVPKPMGAIPKLDPPLKPKGNKKENPNPLPFPSPETINQRHLENEKAAKMDDLTSGGTGVSTSIQERPPLKTGTFWGSK